QHRAPAAEFSAERILIIPKPGHEAALANEHAAERATVKHKFPGLGNIHILELAPGADPQMVVARYRRNGHVNAADLDYREWRPAANPNDPGFTGGIQWYLNNTGQSGGIPDADIDAPEAWNILSTATNVIVAV